MTYITYLRLTTLAAFVVFVFSLFHFGISGAVGLSFAIVCLFAIHAKGCIVPDPLDYVDPDPHPGFIVKYETFADHLITAIEVTHIATKEVRTRHLRPEQWTKNAISHINEMKRDILFPYSNDERERAKSVFEFQVNHKIKQNESIKKPIRSFKQKRAHQLHAARH